MARLNQRIAALPQFTINGYSASKGVNIIFYMETPDNNFKTKVINNTLDFGERNFVLSTVREYFADTVRTDENLFNYGVGSIILDYMTGNLKLEDGLINKDFIDQNFSRKNQKSKAMEFNKNKFNAAPLDQKLQAVVDLDEFIDEIWIKDNLPKNRDINNIVTFQDQMIEDEPEDNVDENATETKVSSMSKVVKTANRIIERLKKI